MKSEKLNKLCKQITNAMKDYEGYGIGIGVLNLMDEFSKELNRLRKEEQQKKHLLEESK